jgi:hypothetical protein
VSIERPAYAPAEVDQAAETARRRFGSLQSGVRSGQERPRPVAPPLGPELTGNGAAEKDGPPPAGGGDAPEAAGNDAAETARSKFGSLQAGLRAGQGARDDEEER